MLKASQSLLLFRAFVFQGAAAVTAREPYVSSVLQGLIEFKISLSNVLYEF